MLLWNYLLIKIFSSREKHIKYGRLIRLSFNMQFVNHSFSTLNGLVLAGGKSTRMGEDKSIVQWHNKEQHYYVADMLTAFCKEVFISCRAEQGETVDRNYKIITDEYENAGPLGAIVSAFHEIQ